MRSVLKAASRRIRFAPVLSIRQPLCCLHDTAMAPSTAAGEMRVVSLLPAATEMVCIVDGASKLVGRGHEDDYPPIITDRPTLTAARYSFTTSSDIDSKVSESLAKGEGLYFLDAQLLKSLRPDVIITQALCSVCAIDHSLVMRIARGLNPVPQVLSLNPNSVQDILEDIIRVGQAIGQGAEAQSVVALLKQRIARATALVKGGDMSERPRVVFMEWTDPIFCGGHWTPQLIEMAGGVHPLNPSTLFGQESARESFRVSPEAVSNVDPDWVIVSPCGLDIPTTKKELKNVVMKPWWKNLRAVKQGRVVFVDGNQMFNRSGPRIVDAFEWLVGLLNETPACMPTEFPWERWIPEETAFQDFNISADDTHCGNGWKGVEGEGFLDPWDEVMDDRWEELPLSHDIEQAHDAACQKGQSMYQDPKTGYMVFTRRALRERGTCCGNRCRHCPFGHYNVCCLKGPRSCTITGATFMTTDDLSRVLRAKEQVDALHWAGDISSHLALKVLLDPMASEVDSSTSRELPVVLCTFFDPASGRVVPLHNCKAVPEEMSPVTIRAIMDQAKSLRKPLLAIPVRRHWTVQALEEAIEEGLSLVPVKVRRLVTDLVDAKMNGKGSLEGPEAYDRFSLRLSRELLYKFWNSPEARQVKGKLFFRRGFLNDAFAQWTNFSDEFLQTIPETATPLGGLDTFWVHMEYGDKRVSK